MCADLFPSMSALSPCSLLTSLPPPPGTPKPQVTWRKGPSSEPLSGRPGVSVLDNGSLFLPLVSPTDGGDYECQATNEAGSASRRAKLVVYGKQGPRARPAPTLMPGVNGNGRSLGPKHSLEGGSQGPVCRSHGRAPCFPERPAQAVCGGSWRSVSGCSHGPAVASR